MSQIVLAFFVILSLAVINGQYIPPQATVLPLRPVGIRMSIPDEDGISLVAYHVKFNSEFRGLEAGTIARDITKVRDGKWTYEDRSTKLKKGDIIYYWIHIVYEGLGYNLLEQQHIVDEFYDYNGVPVDGPGETSGGSTSCSPTWSKHFGENGEEQKICGGQLIFEETFDNENKVNNLKWTTVEQFSGTPDYEFVVYRNHNDNVKVQNGKLILTPTFLDNTCGNDFVLDGNLTLHQCTGQPGTRECHRVTQSFNILPPIISGRLNTKNLFSFLYGRIVIRAKLPKGDWIYPLLTLEPVDGQGSYVGNDATFNVQLRVACALGNPVLKSAEGEELGGRILRGGFLSRTTLTSANLTTLRANDGTKYKTSDKLWADDYHLYEMEWKPDVVTVKVDGEAYGEKWFDSPLQTPFYITLGIAVGGVAEFPDGCKSQGYTKPWRNVESKALLHFYLGQPTWSKTWKSETKSLKVDYINVWAL